MVIWFWISVEESFKITENGRTFFSTRIKMASSLLHFTSQQVKWFSHEIKFETKSLSGINGNFTTVLIKHYNDLVRDQEEEEENSLRDAVIGTAQDLPPIIFAVAGGFLQQRFGPKRLLISSAVPSILSWVVVGLWPDSFTAILSSRLLAGLANGLLTGNT